MRRFRTMTAATVASVMLLCGTLRADVMQQVPSEALVVIRVNNLQQVNAKAAELVNRLGIVRFAPHMADPLGSMQQELGLTHGIRGDGQAAMAILPDELVEGFDDPLVLLIPITSFQQFLQNFQERDGDGEIHQVTMDDEPAYVVQRGEYAAVSSSRALLELPGRGVALPQVSNREAAAADVAVILNMAAVREQVIPALQMGRAMAIAQLDAAAKRDPEAARYAPLIRAAAEHFISMIETGFHEAEGLIVGFKFSDAGIGSTTIVEFRQGSRAGNFIGQIRNTDQELLRGLPEGRYLMYGGSVQDPQATGEMVDHLVGPLREQIGALGEQGQPIVQYLDAVKAATAAQTGQTFGIIAPTGAFMQESLLQVVSILRGDAEAIRAAQQRVFETQQELMRVLSGDEAQATTTFTANATTIAEVPLDKFETRFEFDPQTPQGAQAQQVITMMYGPGGLNGYTGKIDDGKLIFLMGPPEPALERYITAAKGEDAPMAARVGPVARQLPQERAAVVYVPLDVIVTTIVSYIPPPMRRGMQLQIPPNLPPIGVSFASEGAAARIDAHVPSRLIESLTAAGMQLYMQMMGDMMEGDPGDL